MKRDATRIRAWYFVLLPALPLLMLLAPTEPAAQTDCEAVRCATDSAIAAICPCDDASNHGKYVSCVAHAVKTLDVPNQCRGAIVSCAAQSACGKDGSVACDIPEFGTCNTNTGQCENSGSACGSFVDCPEGTRCDVKRSAAACAAAGGTVRSSGSCCAECGVATTTTTLPASTTTSSTLPTTTTSTSSSTVTSTSATVTTTSASSTSSSSTSSSSSSTSTSTSTVTSTTMSSVAGAFVTNPAKPGKGPKKNH